MGLCSQPLACSCRSGSATRSTATSLPASFYRLPFCSHTTSRPSPVMWPSSKLHSLAERKKKESTIEYLQLTHLLLPPTRSLRAHFVAHAALTQPSLVTVAISLCAHSQPSDARPGDFCGQMWRPQSPSRSSITPASGKIGTCSPMPCFDSSSKRKKYPWCCFLVVINNKSQKCLAPPIDKGTTRKAESWNAIDR
jgi:hypothetical protein